MGIRHYLCLLLSLVLALSLAGCGGAPSAMPASQEESDIISEISEEVDGSEEMPLGGSVVIAEEDFDAQIMSDPEDPNRPWYELGTCQDLEGEVFVLCIFLDDDESSWTDQECTDFLRSAINPAMDWLEEQAAEWGVELDLRTAYYHTYDSLSVHYNGVISDNCAEMVHRDLLEQSAESMGFSSKQAMYERMQKFSGREQVLMLVCVNKPGRCYALVDAGNNGVEYMEHALIYSSYTGNAFATTPATVAHETLHTFGAEDFYTEGTTRVGRGALAAELYPEDIMLKTHRAISYCQLSDFTAYTVGWTDQTPDICGNPDWWN